MTPPSAQEFRIGGQYQDVSSNMGLVMDPGAATLTIVGTGGARTLVGGAPAGGKQSVVVPFTNAQLLALNTTPLTIVAAVAGKTIVVTSATVAFEISSGFTGAPTMRLWLGNFGNYLQNVTPTWSAVGSQFWWMLPSQGANNTPGASMVGLPLRLDLNSALTVGSITAAGGVVVVDYVLL